MNQEAAATVSQLFDGFVNTGKRSMLNNSTTY